MVSIDSVSRAIRERFDSPIGEGNMAAAEAAFSKLRGPVQALEAANG